MDITLDNTTPKHVDKYEAKIMMPGNYYYNRIDQGSRTYVSIFLCWAQRKMFIQSQERYGKAKWCAMPEALTPDTVVECLKYDRPEATFTITDKPFCTLDWYSFVITAEAAPAKAKHFTIYPDVFVNWRRRLLLISTHKYNGWYDMPNGMSDDIESIKKRMRSVFERMQRDGDLFAPGLVLE